MSQSWAWLRTRWADTGWWPATAVSFLSMLPSAARLGSTPLNAPVTGMAVTDDGLGYWMVTADGGAFAFGDAPFFGSAG